jgi:hypothetical protein
MYIVSRTAGLPFNSKRLASVSALTVTVTLPPVFPQTGPMPVTVVNLPGAVSTTPSEIFYTDDCPFPGPRHPSAIASSLTR